MDISRKEIQKQYLNEYLAKVLVEIIIDYIYVEGIINIKGIPSIWPERLFVYDKIYVVDGNSKGESIDMFDYNMKMIGKIRCYDDDGVAAGGIYVDETYIYVSDFYTGHIHIYSRLNYKYIKCNEIENIVNKQYVSKIYGDINNLYIGMGITLYKLEKNKNIAERIGYGDTFCLNKKKNGTITINEIMLGNHGISNIGVLGNIFVLGDGDYIICYNKLSIMIISKETKEIIQEINLEKENILVDELIIINDMQIYNNKIYVVIGNDYNTGYLCCIE